MENLISSPIGLIHLIFAMSAMITGTIVVINTKGTALHKKIGYVYAVSMLMMNLTAFGIYQLFGGFGVFHVLALVSLFALFGGMYPALYRHKVKDWYIQHVRVMGWSVVGLYAAFAAEVGVRFFDPRYFGMIVGIVSGIIVFIGAITIKKRVKAEEAKLSN